MSCVLLGGHLEHRYAKGGRQTRFIKRNLRLSGAHLTTGAEILPKYAFQTKTSVCLKQGTVLLLSAIMCPNTGNSLTSFHPRGGAKLPAEPRTGMTILDVGLIL